MSTPRPLSTVYGQLQDGTSWENVPLTLSTKLAYERSARANRWTPDDNPFTTTAFFSWHAARAAGAHSLSWDEFLAAALDVGVEQDETVAGGDEDAEAFLGEGPTPPAP